MIMLKGLQGELWFYHQMMNIQYKHIVHVQFMTLDNFVLLRLTIFSFFIRIHFWVGLYAYVADTSQQEDRTFRMSLLNGIFR